MKSQFFAVTELFVCVNQYAESVSIDFLVHDALNLDQFRL